jgi:hypothetical protein
VEIDLAAVEPADRDSAARPFLEKPKGYRNLLIGRQSDGFHDPVMRLPGIQARLAIVDDHLEGFYRSVTGRKCLCTCLRGGAEEHPDNREKRKQFLS